MCHNGDRAAQQGALAGDGARLFHRLLHRWRHDALNEFHAFLTSAGKVAPADPTAAGAKPSRPDGRPLQPGAPWHGHPGVLTLPLIQHKSSNPAQWARMHGFRRPLYSGPANAVEIGNGGAAIGGMKNLALRSDRDTSSPPASDEMEVDSGSRDKQPTGGGVLP